MTDIVSMLAAIQQDIAAIKKALAIEAEKQVTESGQKSLKEIRALKTVEERIAYAKSLSRRYRNTTKASTR